MLNSRRHFRCRSSARWRAGLFVVIASLAVPAAVPAPAAAQSLFDLLFNGGQRRGAPQATSAYADPQTQLPGGQQSDDGPRVETGPAVAYCVRLCDGHFFPIQRSAATPVEICSAFCPAAHTKVFSGSSIDYAVARDGSRYSDLGSAFAYRTKVVPGCTCNGTDAFGLVNIKAADDPTLRPGDVVATNDGFVAYNGNRKSSDFTPINAATNVPGDARRKLAQTPIRPASTATQPAGLANTMASGRDGGDRRVQLGR